MFNPHAHFGVASHDSLFWSKMADVPACTVSWFLIFYQYLHIFHYFFSRAFQGTNNTLENFFSALLLLLGTVKKLPAQGKMHANSSMFMVFSSIWMILSAFITYDAL
jgi:hypothetical protein